MIRAKEARLRYLGSCYARFLFLSLECCSKLANIAHERRATNPQLHRQAIATANDMSARQKAFEAGIAKG